MNTITINITIAVNAIPNTITTVKIIEKNKCNSQHSFTMYRKKRYQKKNYVSCIPMTNPNVDELPSLCDKLSPLEQSISPEISIPPYI
jgi:hypothetical protein